jgi:hypothetical protein
MECLREEKKSKCPQEPNKLVSKFAGGLGVGPACAAEKDVSMEFTVRGVSVQPQACTVHGT